MSSKGGGSAVLEIEAGDAVEIALLEGGQPVEVVAFGRNKKGDLPALGLKRHGKPVGLHQILSGDSEDAVRVRFGLFRRGLDIGTHRGRAAVWQGCARRARWCRPRLRAP